MTDPLDFLLPESESLGPVFLFGTVTSVDPLEVQLDGPDSSPRPVTVTTAMVVEGDRVWVVFAGKSTIIAGIVGEKNPRLLEDSDTLYARIDGDSTIEPSWRVHRDLGTVELDGRLYAHVSTVEPSIGLGLYIDGASVAHLRINESGELKIATSANSPAGNVTRPLPFAVAGGRVNITLTAAASGNTFVNFPTGRFTKAPLVCLTQTNLPANSNKLVPKVTGVGTSGFAAYAYTGDGTSVSVTAQFDWVAIQMTEAAAAG